MHTRWRYCARGFTRCAAPAGPWVPPRNRVGCLHAQVAAYCTPAPQFQAKRTPSKSSNNIAEKEPHVPKASHSGVPVAGQESPETKPPKSQTFYESVLVAYHALDPTQRKAFMVLTGASFFLNLSFGVVIPQLPSYAAEMGFGASGVSLVIAMPAAVRLVLNLPMGRLSDLYGRVNMMVIGQALCGFGAAATGLVATMGGMIAARFMVGLGGATAGAGGSAYMADLTDAKNIKTHRGTLMGTRMAVDSSAWVAGPALGGLLCELYGPRTGYMLVGAAIMGCAFAYSKLPEIVPRPVGQSIADIKRTKIAITKSDTIQTNATPEVELPNHEATPGQGDSRSSGLKEWLNNIKVLLACPNQQGVLAGHLVLSLNHAAMITVVPMHCAALWGASAYNIGILFSASAVLGFAGGPLGGWLADRYGRRAVIVPSILVCALGCGAVGFTTGLQSYVALFLLWCAGEALMAPGLAALTADAAPSAQRGQAMALSKQASDLMFATGPLCLGLAYDLGGPMAAMGLLSSLTALGGLFVWRNVDESLLQHNKANTHPESNSESNSESSSESKTST